MTLNYHMDQNDMEKYSMGAATEEESALFEEHFLVCEICRKGIEEQDKFISAMQEAGRRYRFPELLPVRRRFLVRFLPIFAATGLIAVATMITLWVGSRASVTPAFAVNLLSTRGAGIEAKAPPGRNLSLFLDLNGIAPEPSHPVEMVDGQGAVAWKGVAQTQQSKAAVLIPGMAGGTYFVRLYSGSGQLLREYGIQVER